MFSPQPKVDSAILLVSDINKKNFGTEKLTEEIFFKWIKAGFSQKRKKLIRNLESVTERKNLERIFLENKIDTNSRAEDLTLEQWKEILKNESVPREA
jgi:16S rRNA (adenine1518-N6/adenine1519-N6)-dimethyltransferase